jgi:hypothetical protein
VSVIEHWENATFIGVNGWLVREDGERITVSKFILEAIKEAQAASATTQGAVEALRAAHVQVQAAMSPTGPRTAGPLLNVESILRHAIRTIGGQSTCDLTEDECCTCEYLVDFEDGAGPQHRPGCPALAPDRGRSHRHRGAVNVSVIERGERTCDRCAQRTDDWQMIDEAYICADCRAEIAADEAEVEALRQQLRGAVGALEAARPYVERSLQRGRVDAGAVLAKIDRALGNLPQV